MAKEAVGDLLSRVIPRKERKEGVGKAQFFIRHKGMPVAAQAELRLKGIPPAKVLGVQDELLVITPERGIKQVVLGRGQRSDVWVCYKFTETGLTKADLAVSRAHAAIQITFATVEIVDLDSKRGVFLGDRKVKQTGNLPLGEEVRMGPNVVLKHIGVEEVKPTKGKMRSAHKFVRIS